MNISVKTPTDTELREILELQTTIKGLERRLEELKGLCKARGTFSTKNFACVVFEQSQERLAGLAEVSQVFGRDLLLKHNLINVNTFRIAKVSPLVRAKNVG